MSVNFKNDVIKGPVLPSVMRLANQICLDKIFFFGKTLFSEQTIAGLIKLKTFWWENTRGMHLKCLI